MWAIVGTDELSYFENERRIVGLLIAQEFDREVLSWIFDSWEELHFLSGMNWHIAVPCRPTNGNERPKRSTFNVELSNRLREMYGISRSETPVLVLDNFNDEERQLYLRISANERERKAMFTRMAQFIDERMKGMGYDHRPDPAWRRQIIADLYDHIKRLELGTSVLKFAPRAVSAAGRLLGGGT